jgi:hypothetical protein
MNKQVKYTASGKVKLKLSYAQYEDFLFFIDWLPEYQRNSYMTPLQLVWNIVMQKMRDRYILAHYAKGQEQTITLSMEEAVIVKQLFTIAPSDVRGILSGVMMEVDQIVVSHA